MTETYSINNSENIDNMDSRETNIFEDDEFVYTKKGNEIIGGGYKIKSLFLQENDPILATFNKKDQKGGKVSSPFENLAVPAGLFYINMRIPKKKREDDDEEHFKHHEPISDDILDKLYSLVEFDKKRKRKTKKHNIKHDKTKTRKLKKV